MGKPMRLMVGAAALSALALSPASAQERYDVGGDRVAIYNLAGAISVTPASGRAVTVDVRRGGGDASGLRVEVGEVGGVQALRVIYPSDRVVYDPGSWRGNTELRVRPDGTWDNREVWRSRGDRVRVSSRGSGMEAHADLTIGVPRGQRIEVYLAVGRITAENVDGHVLLDTHSGGVSARAMSGFLRVDTGSGSVEVLGMQGDLEVDTGSGSVRVRDVRGQEIALDTGSGSVEADGLFASRIEIDTGSGRIDLLRSSAREVRLDTGSGSVEAELSGEIADLEVDTGSGSVSLRLPENLSATLAIETGSGGIEVDFPVSITRRARDELRGQIGDGRGRIVVDTGSGSIRLRRM
ncbi:MAG TPA: DUF4097 family beta strand repeat-containing protein [Longimicrobiales bacterium]|nr:DUF4097 family beta strand repeat-containing protein [Longimicrobiales bacterium]